MGWCTFEERIDKSILIYKKRLELMDRNRWARRVYEWNQKGVFIRSCIRLTRKYNFRRVFQVSREGIIPHWLTETDKAEGSRWDIGKWKIAISNRIKDVGLLKWREGMEGKNTLELYKGKEKPMKENFYDGSFESTFLFKARTGSLEVKSRTYRWSLDNSKICATCKKEEENIQHLLAECEGYSAEREVFMGEIVDVIGQRKWDEISTSEDYGLSYILGIGMNIQEGVVARTKQYLGRVWALRQASMGDVAESM